MKKIFYFSILLTKFNLYAMQIENANIAIYEQKPHYCGWISSNRVILDVENNENAFKNAGTLLQRVRIWKLNPSNNQSQILKELYVPVEFLPTEDGQTKLLKIDAHLFKLTAKQDTDSSFKQTRNYYLNMAQSEPSVCENDINRFIKLGILEKKYLESKNILVPGPANKYFSCDYTLYLFGFAVLGIRNNWCTFI